MAEDSVASRAFAEGIAHPGQFYLVRMEMQTGFIADFARRQHLLGIVERDHVHFDTGQHQPDRARLPNLRRAGRPWPRPGSRGSPRWP